MLIVWQNTPSPIILDFNEKRLHWASIVPVEIKTIPDEKSLYFKGALISEDIFECSYNEIYS